MNLPIQQHKQTKENASEVHALERRLELSLYTMLIDLSKRPGDRIGDVYIRRRNRKQTVASRGAGGVRMALLAGLYLRSR